MMKIKNGDIELGFLRAVSEEQTLSKSDTEHMKYLESLPENVYVTLDDKGKAVASIPLTEDQLHVLSSIGSAYIYEGVRGELLLSGVGTLEIIKQYEVFRQQHNQSGDEKDI